MVDGTRAPVWMYRGAFLFFAFFILFVKLLPLGSLAGDWPGPDILLCLIFAWIVRRPDFLPVLLVAFVLLLEDLLLMRPPGLWTALVVVATEFLRARIALARELSFWTEWALVAGLMFGLLVGYRVIFAMAFLPQPGFGFAMLQTLWSILCYPVVVAASRFALDLRKPAMGEVDAYGRPL